MDKEISSPPNLIKKVVSGLLGAIVLGAIGSGVWERVGGPLWNWVTKTVVSGIDWLTQTQKDSIYLEAAAGFTEKSSSSLYQVYLTILPTIYLIILLRHPWRKKGAQIGSDDKIRAFLRGAKGFYFLSVMTILLFIQSFISLTRDRYVRGIITYAETTIVRLTPFIDDQSEEELWANLRSVRTANEYYLFYDKLQVLLKEHNLPEYGVKPL